MTLHLILLALVVPITSLDTTKTLTSQIHEFQLNNSAGVMSALDMMPKVITERDAN